VLTDILFEPWTNVAKPRIRVKKHESNIPEGYSSNLKEIFG
jgi:hypothetical protein